MKKQYLLLAVVIVITFIAGFYTGAFYSTKNTKFSNQKIIKVKQVPKSAIKPELKEIPKTVPTKTKVLIGYVQDFRDPDVVDYSKLTHVIFSFAHPTKDGNILLNGDSALTNLRAMVAKADKHGTKVMLAVGGWYHIKGGESYPYFKAAISNPTTRTKLVNNLTKLADREKLDGIDIDFEYPRSSSDAANLAVFTKELSNKLHPKGKELSIAVYSKIHAEAGTVMASVMYDPGMFKDVDHVNIMAYDGQWDGGYHAANLSPYPFTKNVVNYWSNLFKTYHLSKEKLVLGVPFYAQPDNPSVKQVSYAAIINKYPANAETDTVSMNGTIYHYNGETTMRKKTKLALDNGFGGMMLWEAGHDSKGLHSLTGAIFNVLKDSKKQFTTTNR
jgi:chitinase